MQSEERHRGLSTARAALQVTWLLARAPDGVRADEVAPTLGKSVSTAYNLLASLCDEGVAERRRAASITWRPAFARRSPSSPTARPRGRGRRPARPHPRALLPRRAARAASSSRARAGLQGMPKLPA